MQIDEEQGETAQADSSEDGNESVEAISETTKSSSEQYVGALADYFSREQLVQKMRVTAQGLFVEESLVEEMIKHYQSWLATHLSDKSAVSERKAGKRLFGAEEPELQYLIEGKLCIPGYLIPASFERNQVKVIPFFSGGLMSALTLLHVRDPILSSVEDLSAKLDDRGFRILIRARNSTFVVSQASVAQFAGLMRNSRKLVELYPDVQRAARGALPALVRSLQRGQPIPRKHNFLIPLEFASERRARYLRSGEFMFVVRSQSESDQEWLVLGCYSLKGKSLHQFLVAEFNQIKQGSKGRGLRSFEFTRGRQRFLGFLRFGNERVKLEPSVFKGFVEEIPRARSLAKRFRGAYTLKDCLEALCALATQAKRVERWDLPRHLAKEEETKRCRFYRSDRWMLRVSSEGVLESSSELGSSKGPSRGDDSKRGGERDRRAGDAQRSRSRRRRRRPRSGGGQKSTQPK